MTSIKGGIYTRFIDKRHETFLQSERITSSPTTAKVSLPMLSPVPNSLVTPVLKVSDHVDIGSIVAMSEGGHNAIHATVSGTVTEIREVVLYNNTKCQAVVIENDHKDSWAPLTEVPSFLSVPADLLRLKIVMAEVIELDNSACPRPLFSEGRVPAKIDTLILNCLESQPGSAAVFRQVTEQPDRIIGGLRILMRAYGTKQAIIAIPNDIHEVVHEFRKTLAKNKDIKIVTLEPKYPQAHPHLLVKTLLHKEIHPHESLTSNGIAVHSAATSIAVYNAVRYGKPLIERVISVAGPGVRQIKNMSIRFGTPLYDILYACGIDTSKPCTVAIGGQMQGLALTQTDCIFTKDIYGIYVSTSLSKTNVHGPCIKCGRCVDTCPMRLLPSDLGMFIEKELFGLAKDALVTSCIECGCCAYVCPSKRPMVQFMRLGKSVLGIQ